MVAFQSRLCDYTKELDKDFVHMQQVQYVWICIYICLYVLCTADIMSTEAETLNNAAQ